jgi:tRNA nucleotidyltransferase (CCA-adding enzyme)
MDTKDDSACYKLFAHDADIGVRGWGETPARAFENGALALTAIVAEPADVRALQPVAVTCDAPDVTLLFVDWLNALIYEMATRAMLFSRYEVEIRDGTLKGTAWGEPVDRARHQPAAEPKGATYTEARVEQDETGAWIAQCVVDV